MIAFVRGTVDSVGPDSDSAVIDVGGVGLLFHSTPRTLAGLDVGKEGRVATSLVVREESLTLYGFADADERAVFELLQTASGVGPRLALAMLAVHSPDALRRAVAAEDVTALTAVPGIGKKGAQRIVLELKDKLGLPGSTASLGGSTATPNGSGPAATAGATSWRDQVRTGLVGLGWSARDAEEAVDAVAPLAAEQATDDDGGGVDVGVLLRAALRMLSRS